MKYFLVALTTLILTVTTAFAQAAYQIRSGDTLNIEVMEDQEMSRTVLVAPDGRISFPFVGSVTVAGRTVEQVRSAITAGIRSGFAAEPNVLVSVAAVQPPAAPVAPVVRAPVTMNIYFVGEVNSPGVQPMAPGTTFLQALSQAGGFTNFAATKRVQLRRTNRATGAQTVSVINYQALAQGAALSRSIVLTEGDVILVPERGLFE